MLKRAAITTAILLMLSACAKPASQAPGTSAPETSTTATTATTPSSTAPSALAPYFDALDRTLAAGSYKFDGTLEAQTQNGTATVNLSGWVNGADHELVLASGSQQTITTVKDGVATITTAAGTTEIPVSEAAAAPSLSPLRDLTDATVTADGTVTGTLAASVFQGTGLTDGTAAGTVTNATVTFDLGGTLTGYTLADAAHTWTITVQISDVGQGGA